jgi:hypothetical protein
MYPFGPSNANSINPTRAFQDWAYAASWEHPRTLNCDPDSYGGYELGKTDYPVETNRALAFSISTNMNNYGSGKMLGDEIDVFQAKDTSEDKPISRNMRLALVATDLLQPYVSIFGINSVGISDDVVPSSPHDGNLCDTGRIVAVPSALETVIVEWTVGGGLSISETDLWVARVEDIPDNSVCTMSLDDGFESVKNVFKQHASHPNKGTTFFSKSGPDPSPKDSVSKPFNFMTGHESFPDNARWNAMGGLVEAVGKSKGETANKHESACVNLLGPVFRTEINLANFEVGDQLILIASATLDQEWSEPPEEHHQV